MERELSPLPEDVLFAPSITEVEILLVGEAFLLTLRLPVFGATPASFSKDKLFSEFLLWKASLDELGDVPTIVDKLPS